MSKVSVVVPNMNGVYLLGDCIPTIKSQSYPNIEIVVVDDGSTDESVQFLRNKYPETRLIINERNLGFARSVNKGARVASGDYLFVLNNDTRLKKNCIEELVESIHFHEDESRPVAALAPKMVLDYLGRQFIDAVGTSITKDGSAFNNGVGQIDLGQFDKPMQVFGACFGAAFIPKETLSKVGLLDESYYAYYEDVDWNYRANILGYEIYTVPTAVVYHRHSATWSRVATYDKKYYFIHRNFLRTVAKNYYHGNMVLALIRRSTSHTLDAMKLLWRRKYRRAATHIRILLDTYLRLPVLLTQNYMLNRKRKVQDGYIWSLGSPRIIKISSATFDPSTYSPVLTLDVFEEIYGHLAREVVKTRSLDLSHFRAYVAIHLVNMIWKTIRVPGIPQFSRQVRSKDALRLALGPLVIASDTGGWKIFTSGRCIHTDQFLSTLLVNSQDRGVEDLTGFLVAAHPLTKALNLKEEVRATLRAIMGPLVSIGLLREQGGKREDSYLN